ncbi:MAG: two component transcriptional regulator, AraC family [Lacrimispora sp.]|nr:two component transcriptional regulator, AraC family [Lacrimispora sp.]
MKQVLIVDDDTIIRITLRSLIDWNEMGYSIAADAINGQQALDYIRNNPVDLVITDMKMPVMDGIELLKELNKEKSVPEVLVLSGYDDFNLVRDSFRYGASDYILKEGLTQEALISVLERLKQINPAEENDKNAEAHLEKVISDPVLLAEMAMGKQSVSKELLSQDYLMIQFEIEDFYKVSVRFGENYEEELIKPFIELAGQIPRVVSRCIIGTLAPSRYIMLYRITDAGQYQENAVSACRQLCNVWKHFMNLTVSGGLSSLGHGEKEFFDRLEEAGRQLKLCPLKGKGNLSAPWEKKAVSYKDVKDMGDFYKKLLKGLLLGDEMLVSQEKSRFFSDLYSKGLKSGKEMCLHMICALAWLFSENHDDITAVFPEEVNYYEKIGRIDEIRSLELWINNYFRWIMDYHIHQSDRKQMNMMSRAKRFILDNYANPELTLGSVAGFIGFNEKYFSTRFTKEEGMTFINYLTEVRIRKAIELMETTDLKIYEVSQRVGYNNVEHFTRVFKKYCGVSPGGYRK